MYFLIISIIVSSSTVDIHQKEFHEQYSGLSECLHAKYDSDLELTKRIDVDIESFTTRCIPSF